MAHTCKRLFPCGHPIYPFVDLMSGCFQEGLSVCQVCHTGTCLHIFVSSITWCSCEIFRHTPNSFRFSARNTQSCKVSLWRLTAVQEMASFNKCTWNLSTPLSIPTYQNMSKHQRKISQVYHGRKVDVLTLYHFKLTFP